MTFKKHFKCRHLLLALLAACSIQTNAQQQATLMTEQELYYYYFNATQKNNFTGKQYKLDLDQESSAIEIYINKTKDLSKYTPGDRRRNFETGANFGQLDQFDAKRMMDSAKREIRRGMKSLDYNREYAFILPLSSIGQYYFEKEQLEIFLVGNMDVGGRWGSFFLTFLNGMPINKVYLSMNAEKAEALVKGTSERKAIDYMAYVVYFKMLPYCYVPNNRYLSNALAARISRIEFYHKYYDEESGTWKLGEKFGEKAINQDNFPNAMIGTK